MNPTVRQSLVDYPLCLKKAFARNTAMFMRARTCSKTDRRPDLAAGRYPGTTWIAHSPVASCSLSRRVREAEACGHDFRRRTSLVAAKGAKTCDTGPSSTWTTVPSIDVAFRGSQVHNNLRQLRRYARSHVVDMARHPRDVYIRVLRVPKNRTCSTYFSDVSI